MDIEFHYHITYILARKSGFKKNDAFLTAYSSQYVDDNCYRYFINFENGSHYINEVSQTMDITKPSPKRQKIYPIFHFIPGDPNSPAAKRKDGKKHPMNTTPNSKNAGYFFEKAPEYKENAWRHNAIDKEHLEEDLFDRYWARKNFFDSHWYKFQEAVIEHRNLSLNRLKPVYKKAGLNI